MITVGHGDKDLGAVTLQESQPQHQPHYEVEDEQLLPRWGRSYPFADEQLAILSNMFRLTSGDA